MYYQTFLPQFYGKLVYVYSHLQLSRWNGSGTIFFGMCNLRCVFCQNWDISQKKNGWELDAKEIADLMLKLQNETK